MSIYKKLEKLGYNEYINCYLIQNNVRDGYLIQAVNYIDGKSVTINNYQKFVDDEKLKLIAEYFPHLNISILPGGQEILITKNIYNISDIKTSYQIGKILGFPCPRDNLKNVGTYNSSYSFSINVYIKNKVIQLIAFVCLNKDKYLPKAELLKNNIKQILKQSEFKSIIKDVKLIITHNFSIDDLIKKLLNNKSKFSDEEKSQINEYIYNIGLRNIKLYKYLNYNNLIHRGILIALLSINKNNILSPFFPLQNYPEQYKEVLNIENLWNKHLIKILTDSKAKTRKLYNHKNSIKI